MFRGSGPARWGFATLVSGKGEGADCPRWRIEAPHWWHARRSAGHASGSRFGSCTWGLRPGQSGERWKASDQPGAHVDGDCFPRLRRGRNDSNVRAGPTLYAIALGVFWLPSISDILMIVRYSYIFCQVRFPSGVSSCRFPVPKSSLPPCTARRRPVSGAIRTWRRGAGRKRGRPAAPVAHPR
jgi:hypothetical protein